MGDGQEVSSADQKDINAFSKLNAKYHELQDELKETKDILVNLQDAQNEVLMVMDDSEPIKMSVGEVFFDLSQDDATAALDERVAGHEETVTKFDAELAEVKGEMATLKGRLTAKFGKSINLEEED
mmetsp:Transcript_47561/g.115824  ORF Transcript_47561/g.115824 Transcript_47561/m.115824 type:complete len:126 (-) Transcript_47561:72-449(-)